MSARRDGGGARARARACALACALLGAGLGAGCALSHTVPDAAFADMSVDKTLRLFEAENDVSAAADDATQMAARHRELAGDRRAADAAAAAAQRAGDGKLAAMWTRRSAYLVLSRAYLGARMQAQARVVLEARGKFELAKALLVKKNRLAGAEALDTRPFEQQAQQLERAARAALAEVARAKPAVERARAEWLALREAVVAESLASRFMPGEDEQPVYELW